VKRETKKIRVLLADDHNVLREGLRSLLQQEPDIDVVLDVADGRTAVNETQRLAPDVVVMDISMPGLNGIDATRKIAGDLFNAKVLCLSVHREKSLVQAMLEAGASGYLLKTSAADELIQAVRTVAEGGMYLSPPIAGDIVEQQFRSTGTGNRSTAYTELTEREREVLQLVAEGCHTKEIADRLHISPKTVLAHLENMMRKLDVDSIASLTRYALREGISEL
jgi:DNA-binding NarL/FixJ family response regulator